MVEGDDGEESSRQDLTGEDLLKMYYEVHANE